MREVMEEEAEHGQSELFSCDDSLDCNDEESLQLKSGRQSICEDVEVEEGIHINASFDLHNVINDLIKIDLIQLAANKTPLEFPPYEVPPITSDQIILRALKYIYNLQFAECADRLEEAIALLVSDTIEDSLNVSPRARDALPVLYSRLIELYYEMGLVHRAVSVGKEFKDNFPSIQSSYYALSFCQSQLGFFEDAIQTCTEGLQIFTEDEKIFHMRGQLYYQTGKYKLASGDFHYSTVYSRRAAGLSSCVERSLKPWLNKGMK